ncbi:hypothetical protein EVAR_77596_1 [Eumeta japonica]|uniref:Uncharacterized protein n=1 Tax=Eumeta variegata TaxID=151549 RepID=A0A4C1T6S5_EUMVA|nr:hypothetical protein EVAR_77596_1 [Eumeta japonica]
MRSNDLAYPLCNAVNDVIRVRKALTWARRDVNSIAVEDDDHGKDEEERQERTVKTTCCFLIRSPKNSTAMGLCHYLQNGNKYVLNKWNGDGEEASTSEAGERNENEAGIATGRPTVKALVLSCTRKGIIICACKTICVAIEDDDHGKEEDTYAKEDTPAEEEEDERSIAVVNRNSVDVVDVNF